MEEVNMKEVDNLTIDDSEKFVDLRTGIISNHEFYGIKFHAFYTPKRRKLVGVRTSPGLADDSLREGFEVQMYEIDITLEDMIAVVKRDGVVLFSVREYGSSNYQKLESMALSALRARIRRAISGQLKKKHRRARKAAEKAAEKAAKEMTAEGGEMV